MSDSDFTRRQFLRNTAVITGVAIAAPWGASQLLADPVKRTATDQVTLGNTGIRLSRLGMGTGVDNGRIQAAIGKDAFCDLIKSAFDQGITFFDSCDRYETTKWMADAIKPLPREKIFLQSKISGQPTDIVAAIDAERKRLNTDYFDSMLIHSQTVADWTSMDPWKKIMDGFVQAKEKQWIRAKGISCHNLPALRDAVTSPWPEIHLVRVNPQGKYVDGPSGRGYVASETFPVEPALEQIQTMREKGRGVIGMKIFGNGLFTEAADREKSIRFALSNKNIDAIVIGFKSRAEITEAIERINRALAELN